MPALDWIGIVTLFGIAVSINWWVVKSYSDRMEKRFDGQDKRFDGQERRLERLETLMLRPVGDVGLLMGAMGIYPGRQGEGRLRRVAGPTGLPHPDLTGRRGRSGSGRPVPAPRPHPAARSLPTRAP